MRKIPLLSFCLTVLGLIQVSGESNTYRGAVVDYSPEKFDDENVRVSANVRHYVSLIESAKKSGAEIIVFPEGGLMVKKLYSAIPDPADRISPCDSPNFSTTEAVRKLSCASKENRIYSVVNLPEKRDCRKDDRLCPARRYHIYNTNVVFDREGVVIARYSKFHPFDEQVDKTARAEIVTFDTDFGVRFGTFICFDILFRQPALELVQKYNVTNFVFTTYWFSELPFLTAVQTQRGWAETNNVNLLASGVNNPISASFGSGIYNGKRGHILQTMTEKPTTSLLVANIPKTPDLSGTFFGSVIPIVQNATNTEVQYLRDQMELYRSEIIDPSKTFESEICGEDNFCCSFRVSVDSLAPDRANNYTLRAVVLNAARKFGLSVRGGVQGCGVLVCEGPHIMNCTNRMKGMPEVFRFNEIRISGSFPAEDAFQIPNTLTEGDQLEPLMAENYLFRKNRKNGMVQVSLELVEPKTNIRTFAIWGRNFRRDSSSSAVIATPLLIAAVALLQFFDSSI